MDIKITFAEYFQEMPPLTQVEFAGLLNRNLSVLTALRLDNQTWLNNMDPEERDEVLEICPSEILH